VTSLSEHAAMLDVYSQTNMEIWKNSLCSGYSQTVFDWRRL